MCAQNDKGLHKVPLYRGFVKLLKAPPCIWICKAPQGFKGLHEAPICICRKKEKMCV